VDVVKKVTAEVKALDTHKKFIKTEPKVD